MKDLKNIIKDLWYQKYNKIKMFNDCWLNETSIRNFSREELENFQNLKDLHFCISGIDNLEEAMFATSKHLHEFGFRIYYYVSYAFKDGSS